MQRKQGMRERMVSDVAGMQPSRRAGPTARLPQLRDWRPGPSLRHPSMICLYWWMRCFAKETGNESERRGSDLAGMHPSRRAEGSTAHLPRPRDRRPGPSCAEACLRGRISPRQACLLTPATQEAMSETRTRICTGMVTRSCTLENPKP